MKFAKMQATGNDFIVIEAAGTERDWPSLAKAMCDRHFGVGADGLILVLPSRMADIAMRFFNPDGSEAEACGNGLRCLARYAIDSGYPEELAVETSGGIRKVRTAGRLLQVGMGVPRFKAEEIPMLAEEQVDIILDYPITVSGEELFLTCLSMGNPHAVCFWDEPVANFALYELGPKVENHPIFPNKVNFEVANVLGRKKGEGQGLGAWGRGDPLLRHRRLRHSGGRPTSSPRR